MGNCQKNLEAAYEACFGQGECRLSKTHLFFGVLAKVDFSEEEKEKLSTLFRDGITKEGLSSCVKLIQKGRRTPKRPKVEKAAKESRNFTVYKTVQPCSLGTLVLEKAYRKQMKIKV